MTEKITELARKYLCFQYFGEFGYCLGMHFTVRYLQSKVAFHEPEVYCDNKNSMKVAFRGSDQKGQCKIMNSQCGDFSNEKTQFDQVQSVC